MVRLAAPICLLALVSCGTSKRNASLIAALKEDAGYSEKLLTLEADSPDASLTEFDAFCDRSVELRTERLIKIRALELPDRTGKAVAEYFNAENSLVRAKRRFYDSYSELRGEHETYASVSRKAQESFAEGTKYGRSTDIEGLRTAIDLMRRSQGYDVQSIGLIKSVNLSVKAALKSEVAFLEAMQKAVLVEQGFASDLGKIGVRPEMPISRLAGDTVARLDSATKAIRSQTIK